MKSRQEIENSVLSHHNLPTQDTVGSFKPAEKRYEEAILGVVLDIRDLLQNYPPQQTINE